MVRKQVYIEPEQDERLKRRAEQLGVTESELIRRSIDQFTRLGAHPPRDPAAGERLIALLDELDRELAERTPDPNDHYKFSREDAYAERLSRFLD